MAAKSNLGQFFVLGDCWFFVHLPSPTVKFWFVEQNCYLGAAKLVAAKSNLGQFFVLGDCWFLVHVHSPKFKNLAVPGGNMPLFDQMSHLILDAIRTFLSSFNSRCDRAVSCGNEVAIALARLP